MSRSAISSGDNSMWGQYKKIVYRTKNFYSFETLKFLYDIENNDFLKYNQLISSIPSEIKLELASKPVTYNEETTLLSKIRRISKPCKLLQSFQLKNKTKCDITSENKWTTITQNPDLDWKRIYQIIYKTTIDVKLRNFQYKFLFRIIATNKRLFKYGLKVSNLCDFCSMNIETQEHLFWQCEVIQELWNKLQRYLNQRNVNVNFNLENISLGLTDGNENNQTVNFILMLTKYYIFQMKNRNQKPNINGFLSYLNIWENIEKEVALSHNKLPQHNAKWSKISTIM